jgi:hypothetical protein
MQFLADSPSPSAETAPPSAHSPRLTKLLPVGLLLVCSAFLHASTLSGTLTFSGGGTVAYDSGGQTIHFGTPSNEVVSGSLTNSGLGAITIASTPSPDSNLNFDHSGGTNPSIFSLPTTGNIASPEELFTFQEGHRDRTPPLPLKPTPHSTPGPSAQPAASSPTLASSPKPATPAPSSAAPPSPSPSPPPAPTLRPTATTPP